METGKCEVRKADIFEDKSIFRLGLTYVQHHETLTEFIKRQQTQGNKICFPLKDFETILVLEKDSGDGEHFLLYDIFNERIKRKFDKPRGASGIFTVDPECSQLLYAKGKGLGVYSLEVPEELANFIKPIYFSKDHNRNPGRIVKEKDRL